MMKINRMTALFCGLYLLLTTALIGADLQTSDAVWQGEQSSFHGFDQYDFKFEGNACKVVVPQTVADGKPWVWRARFWGHEPQFDIAMLERGYHVVYCHVGNLFGNAAAVKRWDAFYDYLRFEHLFADRVVLEGMSRGGLIVYNWAAVNPEKVAAIYADAPVMDFKSWPGGKGSGKGAAGAWRVCLKAYGFSEAEALAYPGNPLDHLAPLAKAGIPIIHVVGDTDDIVPVVENTAIAQARYKELGGVFEVIHKPDVGHHPHSLKDPQPIVDFVLKHTSATAEMTAETIVSDRNFILRGSYQNSRIQFERNQRGHVAFIGGSITEMDGYRPKVCAMLETRFPKTAFTFTQAGISSTCSDTGAFRFTQDVLSQEPLDLLLGEKVHARFGDEFPIRFDFLDTIEGGNLSFQVHPLTEYIQQHFGMHYTQDESYYYLDATEDATMYLGTKAGIDREAMVEDLRAAQRGEKDFDDASYVNCLPAKKHDHFLIPAGTVHCGGDGGMVLEISATPYIFTFKMWDWGRLGLDGLPRPINVERGVKNIAWERDEHYVREYLHNNIQALGSGEGWREERTGLHEREFIETRRHWFTDTVPHDTEGGVNVINLVEGREVIVESPSAAFEPFVVHYAETFIVPAAVGAYTIRPHGESIGKECATLKAYVRT